MHPADPPPPRRARDRRPASTRAPPARSSTPARSMPDEMRAVHIAVDRHAAEQLADEWRRLGLSRVPLELVDCPDRRVDARRRSRSSPPRPATARPRSACCCRTACTAASGTGCCTTTPATRSPACVSQLPHANVTTVPFHFGPAGPARRPGVVSGRAERASTTTPSRPAPRSVEPRQADRRGALARRTPDRGPGAVAAGAAVGQRADARGRRGRRHRRAPARVPRPPAGRRGRARPPHRARGMVGEHRGYLAILNPGFELL